MNVLQTVANLIAENDADSIVRSVDTDLRFMKYAEPGCSASIAFSVRSYMDRGETDRAAECFNRAKAVRRFMLSLS